MLISSLFYVLWETHSNLFCVLWEYTKGGEPDAPEISGIPYLVHPIGKTTMQKAKILSSERFPMNNNVRRIRYVQKLEALKRNGNHQFPVTIYR
ncbi:hypothetical protein QE193_09665 [Arsenophonus nasoniae]|nr:hypothetical protein [Arsenophonus nasoniae]WGM17022.1 hypothetical protein QE193_08635 [Arsenophonus nasoniae]WGM17198.1 hypothetical protein QE193_09665 [Arsenophonus nasoniae]